MDIKTQSDEIGYLTDLLKDFASENAPSPELAVVLVQLRYGALASDAALLRRELIRLMKTDSLVTELPKRIHQFLYQDILANAGEYRHVGDRGQGQVWFGNNGKFQGTPPSLIESYLRIALSHLILDADDPVGQAATFYQQFVQIHPFYDANGRIGRLIVNSYLSTYRKYIDWKRMVKTTRWLKRLNECHKRNKYFQLQRGNAHSGYSEYLERHKAYWRSSFAIDMPSESELPDL